MEFIIGVEHNCTVGVAEDDLRDPPSNIEGSVFLDFFRELLQLHKQFLQEEVNKRAGHPEMQDDSRKAGSSGVGIFLKN
jgi:hypothetical protein